LGRNPIPSLTRPHQLFTSWNSKKIDIVRFVHVPKHVTPTILKIYVKWLVVQWYDDPIVSYPLCYKSWCSVLWRCSYG
jgi:hypothetical protein